MKVLKQMKIGRQIYKQIKEQKSDQINKKVGFIGLGQMGLHMAKNLSDQFEVYGVDSEIDILRQRMEEHKIEKIKVVKSIKELPQCSQYVLSLPNNSAVQQVVEQISKHVNQKVLVVDTSTISPQLSKQCSHSIQLNYNSLYVDAPVSGGVLGSINKTLTFMLGLNQNHLDTHTNQQLHSLLDNMGKKKVYCGGIGMGQSVKLVNNLALAIQMMSICETFAAGQLLGINPQTQFEVFSTSTSRCWSVDTYVPVPNILQNVPANKDYNGGFGVNLLLKDLGLIIDEIQSAITDQNIYHNHFSITQQVFQRYQYLKQIGLGNKDFGVMFQSIQNIISK